LVSFENTPISELFSNCDPVESTWKEHISFSTTSWHHGKVTLFRNPDKTLTLKYPQAHKILIELLNKSRSSHSFTKEAIAQKQPK
jgi:hypothetical protein